MMSKADHIAYWMNTAQEDWVDLQELPAIGKNVWALFFAHLCIEKLSKALWVKERAANLTPPRSHNIAILLDATSFVLTTEQANLVSELNKFQLEGRYPNHERNLRQIATAAYTSEMLADIADLRQCLLNKLL